MDKKKIIGREELFEEISKVANYCDKELVKEVYYGMIKVMGRQLNEKGKVKLPDWGDFELKFHSPRRFKAVDGSYGQLGMKRCLKFSADYKVKAYFRGE